MFRQPPPYDPSHSLDPQPARRTLNWDDPTRAIFAAFPQPDQVYVVGGAVRDALLGYTSFADLDFVTTGDGLSLARAVANTLDGAYYPVDAERGTGRVILNDGAVIDIASPRHEDFLTDFTLRDFTVNAIACRLDQLAMVVDPLDGQGDLFDRRVLRQCHPDSITSDPVRALRSVRHSLKYNLRMLPDTVQAAKAAPELLTKPDGTLNQPERIRDELYKILSLRGVSKALTLMQAIGLIKSLTPYPVDAVTAQLPHVEALSNLLLIISPQRDDNIANNLMLGTAVMILDRFRADLQDYLATTITAERNNRAHLILAALTPPDQSAETWAEFLRLSNQEAAFLRRLSDARRTIPTTPPVDGRAAHIYYRGAQESGIGGVLLHLAGLLAGTLPGELDPVMWSTQLDHVASPLIEATVRRHDEIVAPPPLLTGNDLQSELGMKPGKHIGDILAQLLEEQAAGRITTRDQALDFARSLS